MDFNLNNKQFKSLANSDNGEVSDETIFHYFQEGNLIWAEYYGGDIQKGFLVGKIVNNQLQFTYQHVNQTFEIMTGKCNSLPEITSEGKIRLTETWEWTCKDFSKGTSVLIEME